MAEVLRVKNLIRNYVKPSRTEEKQEIKVLKGLDFSVDEREFVGIMGKSGCGKTIVMVTHDPQVASHCDRLIFLKDGKILRDIRKTGTGEEFYLQILEMMKDL